MFEMLSLCQRQVQSDKGSVLQNNEDNDITMVLFEHEIVENGIFIKQSELMTELNRLIDRMCEAKSENNYDRWVYLSGQVKTIKDILRYFDYPEGRDNTDAVEFGG